MARRRALALSLTLLGPLLAGGVHAGSAAAPAPGPRGQAGSGGPVTWETTVVDAGQSFRGLDAVDRRTAWVTGGSTTGGDGLVYRTTDGGQTWDDVSPPGTEGLGLKIRDV